MKKANTSDVLNTYLEFGQVKTLIEQLKNKPGGYPVSDIFCQDPDNKNKKLYFVDLVQEGGGVLGIALVGYTYALESAGIRFLSLGGTSAGAINTILMAGLGAPAEAKSLKILSELCTKDYAAFVDPGYRVLWPFKLFFKAGFFPRLLGIILLFTFNWRSIFKKRGLCSGTAFESWVGEVLEKYQVKTLDELQQRMQDLPPDLRQKHNSGNTKKMDAHQANPRLAIIAADITTQTKVEFPRMAHLYAAAKPAAALSPRDIVRASMAIPFFFQPKIFSPAQSEALKRDWVKLTGFQGDIPKQVLMVDGGVMSNFPIDVFHEKDRTPLRPTFGVRLGLSRQTSKNIVGLASLAYAAFNNARYLRDFEFLFQNEDYKHLITSLDTDAFNWLDFSIAEEKKLKLFELGVKAAYEFLEGCERGPAFDWVAYKALRRRLLFFSSTDRMESLWEKEDAIYKLGLNKRGILNTLAESLHELHPTLPEPIVEWLNKNVKALQANLAILSNYHTKRDTISILWLDNDPANDCFELSVLRALGINFFTALDDASALKQIEDHPDIRLIVSDSNRNGNYLAGLEFAQTLPQKDIHLPIIMHSLALAGQYKTDQEKQAFLEDTRRNYSPQILDNFVDTRELIAAIVEQVAQEIKALL